MIISLPIFTLPGAAAVATVKPDVEPTVKVSESAGKNVTFVPAGIAAVVPALIVIVVPVIPVTVVPAVIPVPSTTSPTWILVAAATTIVVAPTVAWVAVDATPKPSISTKFTSPPYISAVVALLMVTVVPLIAVT